MRFKARTIALGGLVLIAAIGLVALYRSHRAEVARQGQAEVPIIAASRLERSEGVPRLVLDSSDAERIGLKTAALRSADTRQSMTLVAEVMPEPERVATLRAPLTGRLTAPDGRRWPALGDRVHAGTPLAQVSDARPLTAPLSGIVSEVGARPGEIVETGQVLLRIVDLSRPMVRVIWTDTAASRPPRTIVVAPTLTAPRVTAHLIGPAPEADPITRRPIYLYRAERAWPGAAPGTPAVAMVTGTSGQAGGVFVPDRAVVQWDGLAWAYLQRGPAHFERVRIPTDRPVAGGWITGAPLAAGDTVVVTGAEQLLSEEFRAQVTVGEETGE